MRANRQCQAAQDADLHRVDHQEVVRAELKAFSGQITALLRNNQPLREAGLLPLDTSDPSSLLDKCRDGRLLGHLINAIEPNTIPNKSIKMAVSRARLNTVGCNDIFEITHNNNCVLDGARKLGIKTVNIGAEDLMGGNADLILALLWRLLRAHVMRDINLEGHPELVRLLKHNESLEEMMAVSAEDMLLRWFNYHLAKGGCEETVKNFGTDMMDCSKWVVLLKQVAPRAAEDAGIDDVMLTDDLSERASRLLAVTEELDCREFASVKNIVSGHARLNLAFTATIFNHHVGIQLPSEAELDTLAMELEELRLKLAALKSSEQCLLEITASEESKKSSLQSEVTALESQLEELEVRAVEVDESQASSLRAKNGELTRLRAAAKEKEEELIALVAKTEAMCQEEKESEEKSELVLQEQVHVVEELTNEVARLTQEKMALQFKLEERHSNIGAVTESLLLTENTKTIRSGALVEHIRQTRHDLQAHCMMIDQPMTGLDEQSTDIVQAVQDCLAAQQKAMELCPQAIRDMDDYYSSQTEATHRRLEGIAEALSAFLGQEELPADKNLGAILGELIDLAVKRDKAQAVQVKTLALTLQKKDQLNDIFTEKIRFIAEDQVARRSTYRNSRVPRAG